MLAWRGVSKASWKWKLWELFVGNFGIGRRLGVYQHSSWLLSWSWVRWRVPGWHIQELRGNLLNAMPSSTPPPTKPPSLTIHSTPHSQGSGSHYSYHSQNLQNHYKPYLKEDLKHKHTITLDKFLNEILHLPTDWIKQNESQISCIVDTKPFLDKVSTYCQPVGRETHCYPLFIILANYVVDKLAQNSESNLSFCRNDPV